MDTSRGESHEPQGARRKLQSESGLEAVEYALIAALIVAIVLAAMPALQNSILDVYASVRTTIDSVE